MNILTIASLIVSLTIALSSAEEKFSYQGYRQIRLQPKTIEHASLISQWEHNEDFDMWNRAKALDSPVDISLSPIAFAQYKVLFEESNMPYTVITDNLQQKLDEEEIARSISNRAANASHVGRHLTFPVLSKWITDTVAANPTILTYYSAGKTHMNNDLHVVKFRVGNPLKKVWIDCGIHAREWMSPSTCIWIIDSIIKEQKTGTDTVLNNILAKYEIHIMPVVNPDGYQYTHTTSRMWRKNRRPNAGSTCFGTDLNRNAGYFWMVAGASSNPCSDTFAGPSANSELETQGVQNAIRGINNSSLGTWDSFITIHTYGQWWFTPWGYTATLPADYNNLFAKAKIGCDAITRVHGTNMILGSGAVLLYPTAGATDDWAKGVAQIEYSYCLELRPGQTGVDSTHGFLLPEDRAPNVGRETYAGIKAFYNSIL